MRHKLLTPWATAIAVSVLAGAAVGIADERHSGLPAGIGYAIAILTLLAGVAFGVRAIWLPLAGIGSYGLALFVAQTVSPPSGDDQRALVVLYLTLIPMLFMVPALAGALVRWALIRRSGRGRTTRDRAESG